MSTSNWVGLAVSLTVLILIFGGAWYATHAPHRARQPLPAPQEPPEAPKPSEMTDIIAPLPLLFGAPIRHRYDPEEYERPLTCVTCQQPILPKAEFWEIPILNDERPEAMLAVCLQCDSRSPYDQLETS